MTLAQAIRMIEISERFEKSGWLKKLFYSLEFATILKGRRAYVWDIRKIPAWLAELKMESQPDENAVHNIQKAARWLGIRLHVTPMEAEERIRVKEVSVLCYEILHRELESLLNQYQTALAAQAGSKDYHKELTQKMQKIENKINNIDTKADRIEQSNEQLKRLGVANLGRSMLHGVLSPV